jgi:hypothetical protein
MSIYDKSSLVLIPSGTKTGKVYSQKPVSGDGDFTFTRSSAATRVNADGFIEKETQNFLTYSNTYTDSSWTKSGVSLTSGQAGYDGTNDAYLVTGSATNFANLQHSHSAFGQIATLSIYAKAANTHFIALQPFGSGSGYVKFNLSTGAVHSIPATPITYAIEDAGNGWWRISVTEQYNQSLCNIYLLDASGNFNNSPTDSIYIQDAQLELGLVARDYIETTTTAVEGGITDNVPRLDYTDSSCPALLLEPSRRNAMPHSEYINSIDFSTTPNVVFTNNYALSPEGVQNATRVQFGATGSNQFFYDRGVGNYGKKNTTSFYVKGTNGETIDTYVDGNSSTAGYYFFPKAITLTGDWQRVEHTFDLPLNAGASNFVIRRQSSHTATEILLYGYQWEVDTAGGDASYPTSYIPTYGSSVTRVSDGSPSVTSLQSKGIFASTTGTALLEYNPELPNYIFDFHITATKYIRLFYSLPSETLQVRDTIASQWYFTGLSLPKNQNTKVLLRWSGNTLTAFVNGTKASSDYTLTETIAVDYINFFRTDKTRSVLFFPTALTDQEAIDLTTI